MLPKFGCKVYMHGLVAQQRIDGRAVNLRERTHFVDSGTTFAFLDCHDRGPGHIEPLGGIFLSESCVLSRYSEALAQFLVGQMVQRTHDTWSVQRFTNDLEPSEVT